MEIIGFIAMLLVGGTLGLIGGGGAILTVPILVYLFKMQAVVATSYSLFVVGASSLVGVWRYHKNGLVDYRRALIFALPSFTGTYLARRVLMPRIPEEIFSFGDTHFLKDQLVMTVFALVMLGASVSMIRSSKKADAARPTSAKDQALLAVLGLLVGFVAGFVGAGGGFLIIPSLVVLARMPMATAVGTSLLIISANSLFGFAGDLLAESTIDWAFLLSITAIALVGVFGGTIAARFVPAGRLKLIFGWFVLMMGTYILVRQWRG